MDTKDIGEASEARILSELKSLGFTVLTPFGDNAKYDLVCDNGEFNRVQVKTGKLQDNGVVTFKTQTAGHNNTEGTYHKGYEDGEIDYFAVYCPQTSDAFMVEVEEAPSAEMSIRLEKPKNGQTKGINMADDYRLTERFK